MIESLLRCDFMAAETFRRLLRGHAVSGDKSFQ